MSGRETVQAKARRYLVGGRLLVERVDPGRVVGVCAGDSGSYTVSWDPEGGWACSCPAMRRCSHLVAVGLVVGDRR